MADEAPEWLNVMRTLNGTHEVSGPEANPVIAGMSDEIGKRYPEQKWYCDLPSWDSDETAWCGLSAAYCMAMADIRPPFKDKPAPDTDRWGWALAWADDEDFGEALAEPRLGCVVVMERDGGGHVTFFEHTADYGNTYMCRGGNQSNSVNLSAYNRSSVVALIWPREAGPVPPAPRRTLQRGDTGSDVTELQRALGFPPGMCDGEFGSTTEAGVMGFQVGWALDADGVVGPDTWDALDNLDAKVEAGSDGLDDELIDQIIELAEGSALARYSWDDRGVAPIGYTSGMALTYALAVAWLDEGNSSVTVMAAGERGQPDTDALSYYKPEMEAMGWDNKSSGIDTLRHLFALLIGLGMRESSGNHFCGRDQSASNTDANTCEAGMFQSSWNFSGSSPEIPKLFDAYWADPNGFLDSFNDGITTNAANLKNYGTGKGAAYQWLAKYAPAFAAMSTAVGLRKIRKHWGPIGRNEVELVEEADELLRQVEELIAEAPEPVPEPEPEPTPAVVNIQISASGPVSVVVNGTEIDEL